MILIFFLLFRPVTIKQKIIKILRPMTMQLKTRMLSGLAERKKNPISELWTGDWKSKFVFLNFPKSTWKTKFQAPAFIQVVGWGHPHRPRGGLHHGLPWSVVERPRRCVRIKGAYVKKKPIDKVFRTWNSFFFERGVFFMRKRTSYIIV